MGPKDIQKIVLRKYAKRAVGYVNVKKRRKIEKIHVINGLKLKMRNVRYQSNE